VHYDVDWRRRRQGLAGLVAEEDLAGVSDSTQRLAVVGISGSPSKTSKSRVLVEYALAQLAARGATTQLVDLAALPAEPLLGRGTSAAVAGAIEATTRAGIIVAGTPVYRATYSGLLKVFFDLLPQDSLIGRIGVPLVTGHGAAHALSVDHGLRPLFASLGATVTGSAVYATSQQFIDGKPGRELLEAVDRAVAEALALARAGLSGPGRRGT
jgi:FMN reductase